MKPFEILDRKMLIDSPYMPIEEQTVRLPNGKTASWFVHKGKGAVIIVPLTTQGEVLLQKTYKHGCGEIVTEFCAGMIDAGETPLQAAHRELEEETGYLSPDIRPLGTLFANPTGSQMKYHFFLAQNCHPQGKINLDDAEQIENFTVPHLASAQKLLTDPTTKTSTTALTALLYAQNFYDSASA